MANPGRPVKSPVNCHTSKISEYVEYYLQTVVKKNPSYLKDTSNFISKGWRNCVR